MTHEELMSLRDVTSRVVYETITMFDGRRVNIPRTDGFVGALYQGPDDGTFFDNYGVEWLVGQVGGERVRRLISR